jgi:CRISPR-associated protein Cst1
MTTGSPLYTYTGNPFVDAGIAAMLAWSEKTRPEELSLEDLTALKAALLNLYMTPAWAKAMFSVFVNYPINNPSFRGEARRREALEKFLDELFRGVQPLLSDQGDCMACGRRSVRKPKNRQHVPMTGSGGLRNYFSHAAEGADYCDTCAFAIQYVPLTLFACGKLLLLQSNSYRVLRVWARRAVTAIQRQSALGEYTGCFNEGYLNARNALFHITQDLILSHEERWAEEYATIRLYHFTNYIQGPDLDIYDLPAPVFRFLAQVRLHERYTDWRRIVRRSYRVSRRPRQQTTKDSEQEAYKNSRNDVYERLLNHQSIIAYFLDISRKLAYGGWDLLTLYLQEVLHMDPIRIVTLKRVGDDLADAIRTMPNGERRLGQLERAASYATFRNVLRRLIHDRLALGVPTPLFTLDEYAEQLFPEGALGWKETQDLLIFRLYEQLHGWFLEQGVIVTDEEADEIVAEER